MEECSKSGLAKRTPFRSAEPTIGSKPCSRSVTPDFDGCFHISVSEVNGSQIREDVPLIKARQLTCKFTPDERADYDSFAEQANRSLIRKDGQGRIMWNTSSMRKLILLSTWTGFYRIEHLFGAERLEQLLKREDSSIISSMNVALRVLRSHIWRPWFISWHWSSKARPSCERSSSPSPMLWSS